MAYAAISKPGLHFNTKLYTGTGSSNAVTGVGFQPDWVWIKNRTDAASHNIYDAVRGTSAGKLKSNTADAQSYNAQDLSVFGTDGFTVGGNNEVNGSSDNMVSWNWKAGNSSGSANTDGSITTTVSANQTAGFSIFTFTGTGSNGTLGHGLNAVPEMYIIKRYDSSNNWRVYHKDVGNTKYMTLETTEAEQTSSGFANNTSPTSSVISVGNLGSANASGGSMLCYAFASKKGYSKFGSYTGNGNANGAFIYTGFKPSFVIFKRTSGGTNDWILMDNKRDPHNLMRQTLYPNTNGAEAAVDRCDFLSNGIKLRGTSVAFNASGSPYIYMAFAENPLVANIGANGIPATAR